MSSREISNSDDVIDSRDVIARIAELEGERDGAENVCPNCDAVGEVDGEECADCEGKGYLPAGPLAWAEENPDDAAELAALTALAEEASGYAPDWSYGETLVRDSYFTEYAMEMLSDIGDLPKEIPHYIVIDEEATARNIQMDYTAVEFDGVTYWVR